MIHLRSSDRSISQAVSRVRPAVHHDLPRLGWVRCISAMDLIFLKMRSYQTMAAAILYTFSLLEQAQRITLGMPWTLASRTKSSALAWTAGRQTGMCGLLLDLGKASGQWLEDGWRCFWLSWSSHGS